MRKLTILLVCIISPILLSGCITPTSDVEVYISPSSSYIYEGDIVITQVMCVTNINISAWELEILYNSSVLQLVNYSFGNIWGSYQEKLSSPLVKNEPGKLSNLFELLIRTNSKNSGTLIQLTFEAINTGKSQITIKDLRIYNNTNEIVTTIRNGTINVYGVYQ